MKRLQPSFDTTVSAFRDLTATSVDGAATRARVLDRVAGEARWRAMARRRALAVGIVLLIFSSGAALAAAMLRWRAPVPARIDPAHAPLIHAAHAGKATRTVPALVAADEPSHSPARDDGERLAYERAHRAHFFADAPKRALAAWDEYLAAYPRGTFAPEARYNRALCLVRLGRTAAATQALRPIAASGLSGYRQREACLLLHWVAERDGLAVAEPSCAGAN